ncbi:MAG: acetyltransferase [Candidatus Rifleibacteriota bacterium]
MKDVIILGAGGHAKVVIDTAILSGYKPVALYDDSDKLQGSKTSDIPVAGKICDLPEDFSGHAFIAIGNNAIRKQLAEKFKNARWIKLIHPSAIIAGSAVIEPGTLICAGSIIQPEVYIGKHCIINTGANLDHECRIGKYVHVGPGCNIAGSVRIEDGCLIGIGSSILPLKKIGSWSILGAGSVTAIDIPPGSKAWGVPARIKKQE